MTYIGYKLTQGSPSNYKENPPNHNEIWKIQMSSHSELTNYPFILARTKDVALLSPGPAQTSRAAVFSHRVWWRKYYENNSQFPTTKTTCQITMKDTNEESFTADKLPIHAGKVVKNIFSFFTSILSASCNKIPSYIERLMIMDESSGWINWFTHLGKIVF